MRKISLYVSLVLFSVSVFSTSCKKEETGVINDVIPEQSDTVQLKYVDISDSSFLALTDSCNIKLTKEKVYIDCGPDQCQRFHYVIQTSSNNLKVSYGYPDRSLLDRGIFICDSLDWLDGYVNGATYEGLREIESEYVGLRLKDGGKVHYGWVHTPYPWVITEYAIDTTGTLSSVEAGAKFGIKK